MLRYTLAMGLLVGLAWGATTWDLGGRTLVEHGAESARGLIEQTEVWARKRWQDLRVRAGEVLANARARAAEEARDVARRAWSSLTDALWAEDARESTPEPDSGARVPPAAPPPADSEAPEALRRARERVVRLEAARESLDVGRPKRRSDAPPPDRPASTRERQALEDRLRAR